MALQATVEVIRLTVLRCVTDHQCWQYAAIQILTCLGPIEAFSSFLSQASICSAISLFACFNTSELGTARMCRSIQTDKRVDET